MKGIIREVGNYARAYASIMINIISIQNKNKEL